MRARRYPRRLGRAGTLGALAVALAASSSARAGGAAKPKSPATAHGAAAPAAPVEESLAERRAVRGSPVPVESPELRELRQWEEASFPRGARPEAGDDARSQGTGIGRTTGDGADDGDGALPGRWGGTGDIPSELRTPEGSRAARPATPPPDSEWLRSLTLPDIPIRWDAQVVRYLEHFRSDPKGRAIMAGWLRRLGRWQTLFEAALERRELPRALVYLAMIESGFDPGSTSRVGAGGVWQFMPAAARAYGLEVSYWVDGRRDPEAAADAAARYLKDLYVRFGSWELVFAAYNAGYGAILKSIARYNTNDYWELCRHEAGLPWESTIYVPKIMAAAIVGNNRPAFGFGAIDPDPAFAFETVEAPPGTTLAAVARGAGARLEVVQSLNPELVRDRTPPDRPAMKVRVPPGTAAEFAASLTHARTAADDVGTVVLRFGESIDDVARARGLPPRTLRHLNGVTDSAELRAGTTIVVPRSADEHAAAHKDAQEDEDSVIVAVPDRVFPAQGRDRVFYRTRDGDVLDEIADVFHVGVDELCEWNNIDASARLHPQMVLQIFVGKGFDPTGVALLDPSKVRVVTLGSDEFLELEAARHGKKRLVYTAKAGDTLAKVGRRYGLTPGDLARINRFSYASELSEGQRIVVYSPTGEPVREAAMGRSGPAPKRPAATTRPVPLRGHDTRTGKSLAKTDAGHSHGHGAPHASSAAKATSKPGAPRRSPNAETHAKATDKRPTKK